MAPPNFCFPLEKNGKNSGTSLPSQPRSAQLSGHLATSSGQFSSLTSRNENLHKSKYIYTLCGWYSIRYGMVWYIYKATRWHSQGRRNCVSEGRGWVVELELLLVLGLVAIHHKFMHSLQAAVTKITIMTTAKRFCWCTNKKATPDGGRRKAASLRMDTGNVHKMFNTIKRAAENDREWPTKEVRSWERCEKC